MSRVRQMVDLRWSDSGDLMLDSNDNDLKDTAKENLQAAVQHIQARLQSTRGDWAGSPETGASLTRFVGKHSTPELGQEMETVILNELVRGGLFRPNEIRVQVFPISKQALAAIVAVTPAGQRETVQIAISYDLQDNKVSLRN